MKGKNIFILMGVGISVAVLWLCTRRMSGGYKV